MHDLLFVGALGLGMRSLVSLASNKGYRLFASDAQYGCTKDIVFAQEVIWVDPSMNLAQIQEKYGISQLNVIYSTAIKKTHPQRANPPQNCVLLHRAQFLSLLVGGQKLLSVMGTHGKTSTSALLATLLCHTDPSFYCGELFSYPNQVGLRSSAVGNGDFFVAEVDESDGSFTHFSPHALLLTNFDGDHFELWDRCGASLALNTPEREFYSAVQKAGLPPQEAQLRTLAFYLQRINAHLIWCADCPILSALVPALQLKKKALSYGYSPHAQVQIGKHSGKDAAAEGSLPDMPSADSSALKPSQSTESFYLKHTGENKQQVWHLYGLYGAHQVSNMTAAVCCALSLKFSAEQLQDNISKFHGINRRMQQHFFSTDNHQHSIAIFDDYAHHPVEIRVTLNAFLQSQVARQFSKTYLIFEPHRAQRLMQHYTGFCSAFKGVDYLYLLAPFQPCSTQIEEIDLNRLASDIFKHSLCPCRVLPTNEKARQVMSENKKHGAFIFMGAGSVSHLAQEIAGDWRRSEGL